MKEIVQRKDALLNDIRGIIDSAKEQAVRSIAKQSVPIYSIGFSIRQFYRLYPRANALRPQLN